MVDYSKWKTIEISDDEDDTHPNIDTASLYRWRHQARVERMNELQKNKSEVLNKMAENEKQLKELSEKAKQSEDNELKEKLLKLELEKKGLEDKEKELDKTEKTMPWNVDTISKEGWSKTIINKPKPIVDRNQMSEQELEEIYKKFVAKNEKKIKHFGLLSKPEDCKSFLIANQDLVCEETASYLALWCLNLEIEGKKELMTFVAKQVVSMQYILELAKQLNVDPRGCVSAFFSRIEKADKEYRDAFEDELQAFKERIRERARKRIEQAMKEVEEEERQQRLGPGGLDPEEVFKTLPESLQKCFETRDIKLLQDTISTLDEEEAKYHLKRCVDSGLWVPDAKNAEKLSEKDNSEKISEEEFTEGIYETPKNENEKKND